jgi:site-specific DNA-cytosine methylase
MDHPKITHLSLCAGYGGIDLGLHRCIPNLRTIAYSEVEAFACELLLARMESGSLNAAPIWPDLKSFPWGKLRHRVDILSGGYPCQPFSSAGKRLGREDPRHLWPYIADGISILRPRLCFFENVEGHISLGLREVIEHLGRLGYSATWGIFSAAEVGATHQRKRVFILAHRDGERGQLSDWRQQPAEQMPERDGAARGDVLADAADERYLQCGKRGATDASSATTRRAEELWPSRPGHPQFGWEPPRVVGNARSQESSRLSSRAGRDEVAEAGQPGAGLGDASQYDGGHLSERNRAFGFKQSSGRQTEPSLGRNADGPAGGLDYARLCVAGDSRVDELRLLGNGVVPAVAERAFRVLLTQFSDDLCPTTT